MTEETFITLAATFCLGVPLALIIYLAIVAAWDY